MKYIQKFTQVICISGFLLTSTTLAAPFELFNFAGASPTGIRNRDVTTNDIDFTGDGNATDGYSRFSFADLSTSGWSAETAEPRIYGGVAAVRVNKSAGFDDYLYGTTLAIRAQSNSRVGGVAADTTPSMNPFRLAAFWQVADTSSDELYSVGGAAGLVERVDLRIMLRNADGNFYVSESTLGQSTFVWDQTTIQNTNWSLINVSTWLNDSEFSPVSLNFNVATSDIGTVQGIGFMADRNTDVGNRVQVRIDSFEVQAIPEPGTLLLVGIALGSLLFFRRRH